MTEAGTTPVPPVGRGDRRLPAFVEELVGTLSVHSQYVLHGSIRDLHLVRHDRAPDEDGPDRQYDDHHTLTEVLWNALRQEGYEALIRFDIADGFTVVTGPAENQVRELLHGRHSPGPDRARRADTAVQLADAERTLRSIVTGWKGQGQRRPNPPDGRPRPGTTQRLDPYRVVVLIDYAARIPTDVTRLSDPERDFFLNCLKLAEDAKPIPYRRTGRALFNPVIWLAEGERDLPTWLVAGSERVRTIGIPLPDLGSRRRMAQLLAEEHIARQERGGGRIRLDKDRLDHDRLDKNLLGEGPLDEGPLGERRLDKNPLGEGRTPDEHDIDTFTRATAGLTLRAMRESAHMALDRGLSFAEMRDAVRIYQLGVKDNPWQADYVRKQIRDGEAYIRSRVKGQEKAVGKTLDILKRAALGLSGAQASHPGSRPRGVLFFAGPTGTGKTELAKSVAHVLFGTEDACLRFDMSEFSAPHSVDRLLGAPPGYVGYEAGGELTTAVRNDPFRVVLFDEIDKADKGVLDKFLQVLEDGRLTDGQGVTTYFSECVLIFTSNLGVRKRTGEGGRTGRVAEPGMPYHQLEEIILSNVKEHFVEEIGRPELMNRLGGNVVVFDYIDAKVAAEIFDSQVGNIQRVLREEQGVHLRLSEEAHRALSDYCTSDVHNGGRGIGMLLETHLINPLARALFDQEALAGTAVTVTGVRRAGDGTVTLDLRVVR
ncbi:AAA family ATPase [Streptomyces sparsogenes]|uniref:AAA family ATPase n=1 Tax=Streptomyces sparsogenes TaxID=67365 RepID=UPI00384E77EA